MRPQSLSCICAFFSANGFFYVYIALAIALVLIVASAMCFVVKKKNKKKEEEDAEGGGEKKGKKKGKVHLSCLETTSLGSFLWLVGGDVTLSCPNSYPAP